MIFFSVDLEYWFSSPMADREKLKSSEKYFEDCTDFLLDILESTGNKATFFTLGELAGKNPELIRKISDKGHEIGFHSYDHTLLDRRKSEDYLEECKLWKKKLENITGKKVIGHRAPAWSYVNWLPEVLQKAGFRYDSSKNELLFHSEQPEEYEIKEFMVRNFGKSIFSIPFSGSIFFRFLPYSLIRLMIRYNEKKYGNVILYTHPWEFFKSEWIKRSYIPFFLRLYNFSFIKYNRSKIERLLKDFRTERIDFLIRDRKKGSD